MATERGTVGCGQAPRLLALGLACLAVTSAAAAGPRYWDWPEGRAFDEATFESAGIDTLGGLTVGPLVEVRTVSGPEVTWRVVSDGRGGWYLGTGHAGGIHHVAGDGAVRIVAHLESTEVFSLAVLPGGDLLAGGGPDGRLARVTVAGDVTEVGRIDGGYVWGIALQEQDGAAWLATGSPAAVYRYRWRDGSLEQITTLPAQNAMDIAVDADRGRVLVATQGPGLVYSLEPGGAGPKLIGDIAQDEARRLLRGAKGTFHVLGLSGASQAFAPGGDAGSGHDPPIANPFTGPEASDNTPTAALYRLEGGDQGREALVPVWAGKRDIMAAAWTERWGWVAAGTLPDAEGTMPTAASAESTTEPRAVLLRLTPPWGVTALVSWSGGDVLDLAAAAGGTRDGEALAIAQAHPAALVLARPLPSGDNGVVTGPPLDGGPGVVWGRLRWEGVAGQGQPRWSVRGGERAQPDASWSAWSRPWNDADRELESDLGRYLQWRVELPPAGRGERAWRVTGISVSARQPNRAPVIEEFRLEQLRGVKMGGFMAGESIIHQYRSGLRAEFTTQQGAEENWPGSDRADPGRAVRVFTWRASDPNGDRLDFRLECRAEGESDWRPASAPGEAGGTVTGNVGSWDTSVLADGRYELRLVASDAPDNPRGERAVATRELGPLLVDNTPPRVEVIETGARDDGRTIHVKLRAADAVSPLAAARLVLADGTAERLDPVDGVCDSGTETFVATVERLRAAGPDGTSPVRLRLEVRDLAGNTGTVEAVVP
ncbi:MAG: hypothetical protein IPK64_11470 [bacterium]|nr:hypothetical protein [bacterium]